MKILFIPVRPGEPHWYDGFVQAIGGRYPIEIFDPARPAAGQFQGVDVVVDPTGCTHEMVDAAAAGGVKLWQIMSVGVDAWPVGYLLEKGLWVAHTPGPFSAVALAEHALLLMLNVAKHIHTAQKNLRSKVRLRPPGSELNGKTLGLIGLGASGRELARRAYVMGMRIMAIDIAAVPQVVLEEHHVEFFGDPGRLDRVLREADYVSIHAPLTSQTRHMLGRPQFALMKPTAVLINVARGGIVDEDALVEALRGGQIAGAGLDVFAQEPIDPEHPLLHMDNVVCTPHIAGVTWETALRRGQAAAENVERIAQNLPPKYQVTAAD
jgi:phosphoglycerate dehydrogenase-like enzyme